MSTGRTLVQPGERYGAEISRFTVPRGDLTNAMAALRGGRGTTPGEYTRLTIDGHLWMSDTDAEYRDHWPMISRMRRPEVTSVLITGLGLGMVVKAAIDLPHLKRIDVLELDHRVIALAGPPYLRDSRVTIHQGDAFDISWPRGTRWDAVWHDIWRDLDADKNLPEMDALKTRYRHRAAWQGFWGRALLLRQRRIDAKEMENW